VVLMNTEHLNRGWHPLILFLICALASSPAMGEEAAGAEVAGLKAAAPLPALLSAEDDLSSNASRSAPESGQSILDLSYIWSVSGIETDRVIMALNQENEILYGQAKYEPEDQDAWNAVVIGSVNDDRVELVLTYIDGGVETITRLNGTYDPSDQSIKGELLKLKDGAISERGSFEAMWINPDTSSYTPATIAQKAEAAVVQSTPSSPEPSVDRPVAVRTGTGSEGYYYDVRKDAARILTGVGDLSQIPIGMGGSGLS